MPQMKTVTMDGITYEIVDEQARTALSGLVSSVGQMQQNKADKSDIPTKVSQLENDSGYITAAQAADLIYPVGSVYLTMSSQSPAALFGGTWQQIAQGRMLMGSATQGSIEQNTGNLGLFGELSAEELAYKFEAGQRGGKFRHTLTSAESGVPVHAHPAGTDRAFATAPSGSTIGEKGAASGTAFYAPSIAADSNWYTQMNTANNTAANAANPHNNMPPYLTVNIWQRTA